MWSAVGGVCLCAVMCLPHALTGRNVGLRELKVERHTEVEEGPWGERVQEGGGSKYAGRLLQYLFVLAVSAAEARAALPFTSISCSHPPSLPNSLSLSPSLSPPPL